MSRGHTPRFAKRYADLSDVIVEAVKRYVGEVQSGQFPAAEHGYKPNREPSQGDESAPRLPEPGRVVALRH
jgi:hypothetical protein